MNHSDTGHTSIDKLWIALNIGNSRLHWAWFLGETLQLAWETTYLSAAEINRLFSPGLIQGLPPPLLNHLAHETAPPELWIASVVPEQTTLWQAYPAKLITLEQIPLQAIYPSLGVDRALALWGAGQVLGWPVLVIDAGTALTFTGADAQGRLVGGAILPGLGLQVRSLAQSTAALPLIELPDYLPQRWALNTLEAIQSGTVYTILAGMHDFIQAWYPVFPTSWIVLTGGDHATLLSYFKAWSDQRSQAPWMSRLIADPHLIFWGIQSLRQRLELASPKT